MSHLIQRLCDAIENGQAMDQEDLSTFIQHVAERTLSVEHITQWLRTVHKNGISSKDTVLLTKGMMHSGAVLTWDPERLIADKHSTGGVGDKMSLMLAPALAACGVDKEAIRRSQPALETELMVAFGYDTINRINPLGFFGMVHVLEGTSIATADAAAEGVQQALGLPDTAFSYLRSHGALDQEHVKFFEGLMNKIDDEKEQDLIIHCAKMVYQLYGDVFRSVTNH